MVCISCGATLDVSNSRPQKRRNQVWRRRHCTQCNTTYTTTERMELGPVLSVNKNGHLADFSADTLFISLYEACRHRPTAAADARGLADTITSQIVKAATRGQISAVDIVAIATPVLKRFDHAAAVSYAAFHQHR